MCTVIWPDWPWPLRFKEPIMETKSPPTRGWLVPRDGGPPFELPAYVVGRDPIRWPPTMPEKKPGEPVEYMKPEDFYRRHVLTEQNVFVYVEEGRDANALPESVIKEI